MNALRRLLPALFAALLPWQAHAQSPTADKRFPLPPANWPSPVMDQHVYSFLLLDRLEYRVQNGDNAQVWDAQAWLGNDYNKLWLKSEGERVPGAGTEQGDLQVLYARLISPFWHLQVGARHEARPGPSRNYGVLGIQGLAPQWFNVEGMLFVRGGEVGGRVEAEYDQRLTQRLVLQPRVETRFSSASDPERGLGSGIRDVELGLRLRYEIRREIAPYVGVSWERKVGATASLAREGGDRVTARGIVAGVRIWY